MPSAIGQNTEPSSCKMTSGDPFLAQDTAQSMLMAFFSPLIKAHAESRTQPVIVFWSAAKTDVLVMTPRTVAIANSCFMGLDSTRNLVCTQSQEHRGAEAHHCYQRHQTLFHSHRPRECNRPG